MTPPTAFGIEARERGVVRLQPGDEFVLGWLAGSTDLRTAIIVTSRTWDSEWPGTTVRAAQAAGLRAYLETEDSERLEQATSLGADGIALRHGNSFVLREPGGDSRIVTVTVDVPSIARAAVAVRLEADRKPDERLPSDVARPSRPQLILLPGMLGDASLWDEVARRLLQIAAIRTVRIDLAQSISALAELVLAEAPPRFALAGHSLGGVVALEIARVAPDRVTRLALLNASGRMPSEDQRSNWTRLEDRVERGEFVEVAEELAERTLPEGKRKDRDLRNASLRMAPTVGAQGLLHQLAAQQSRGDYLDWLPTVAIPTVVVSGDLDEVSPLALQQELAAAIPGAEHHVLAGTGHMSPLENPQELSAVLMTWLTG